MGRFSTTVQIKSADNGKFIDTFTEVMKKRSFVPCSEDEAEQSYLLAIGEGWVTLANEEYGDNRKKAYDDSRELAAALITGAFTVEVVDSDFAVLTLYAPSGSEDEVIVGDGSDYGIDKPARGKRAYWEPLISDGKTWEQFSETAAKNEVFVEDTLAELAAVLGIDPNYVCADLDEIKDKADGVTAFYFKKAAAKGKTLSLNAAFKQVFGEALEPLGFKPIKSKLPFFVRAVNDEIIHYVSVSKETADGRGAHGVRYKCFNVYCGASTVYNGDIDFDYDYVKFNSDFVDSIAEIYTYTHWRDLDIKYRASISRFYYDPTNGNSLISTLKRALAVTEEHCLPVIGQLVTLEKCMEYFREMNHFLLPFLGGNDEGLLCTKLFSADEFVMFMDKNSEREIEKCRRELDFNPDLSPKMRASYEARINYVTEKREEQKKKAYDLFINPELREKAPAELERRKKENIEKLREYGLNI